MTNLDTPKTPGLLSLKPQPGGSGPVEINDGQSFLNKVAQAAGMHKVQRWQGEASPVTVTTEGGSTLSVTPAGSEDEFLQEKNRLVLAFEEAVGRAPSMENGTPDDTVFWENLAAMHDAYTGPTLSSDAVFAGTVVSDLTDRLAGLEAAAEDARVAHRRASDATSNRAALGDEVTRPLREFQARNNPFGDRPQHVEEERKLTAAVLAEVKKRKLVLRVLTTAGGYGFSVTDPGVDEAVATALAAKIEADAAVTKFKEENGDDIVAEQAKADADAIREALAGDDPDAIRRAISGQAETPAAMTTADLREPEKEQRFISDGSPELERIG